LDSLDAISLEERKMRRNGKEKENKIFLNVDY